MRVSLIDKVRGEAERSRTGKAPGGIRLNPLNLQVKKNESQGYKIMPNSYHEDFCSFVLSFIHFPCWVLRCALMRASTRVRGRATRLWERSFLSRGHLCGQPLILSFLGHWPKLFPSVGLPPQPVTAFGAAHLRPGPQSAKSPDLVSVPIKMPLQCLLSLLACPVLESDRPCLEGQPLLPRTFLKAKGQDGQSKNRSTGSNSTATTRWGEHVFLWVNMCVMGHMRGGC